MVELRHLRYFLEVARYEHVSRAADALHVTQSTLSHQINQLETVLGIQL
ncbi:MAG: LysR family transcriptional regulator, partial [Candidatus Afipia apatlaquensis]|nr:LysR family transcriptional regulator [Candidatus Afipia apatlaquensis]